MPFLGRRLTSYLQSVRVPESLALTTKAAVPGVWGFLGKDLESGGCRFRPGVCSCYEFQGSTIQGCAVEGPRVLEALLGALLSSCRFLTLQALVAFSGPGALKPEEPRPETSKPTNL